MYQNKTKHKILKHVFWYYLYFLFNKKSSLIAKAIEK